MEASFGDAAMLASLRRVERYATNATPLLRAVGLGLVRTTRARFRSATDPDGRPWHPLNPDYAADKRGPGILRESGMRGGLMGSITSQASGRQVIVGSNKVYAAVHQFGATIKPKGAKALMFRIGGRFVMARSVTIPARPYLGFGPKDREVALRVVGVLIERALRVP